MNEPDQIPDGAKEAASSELENHRFHYNESKPAGSFVHAYCQKQTNELRDQWRQERSKIEHLHALQIEELRALVSLAKTLRKEHDRQVAELRDELATAKATCAELVTDGNAITLAQNLAKVSIERDQLLMRVQMVEEYQINDRLRAQVQNLKDQPAKWKEVAERLAAAIATGNSHGYGLRVGDDAIANYIALLDETKDRDPGKDQGP